MYKVFLKRMYQYFYSDFDCLYAVFNFIEPTFLLFYAIELCLGICKITKFTILGFQFKF